MNKKSQKQLFFYDVNTQTPIILKDKMVFGRSKGDINFEDDSFMSGAHCQISIVNNKVYLVDLGSKNKTKVNGNALVAKVRVSLKIGDKIEFGHQIFQFADQARPKVSANATIFMKDVDQLEITRDTNKNPQYEDNASMHNIEVQFEKKVKQDPEEIDKLSEPINEIHKQISEYNEEIARFEAAQEASDQAFEKDHIEQLQHLKMITLLFMKQNKRAKDNADLLEFQNSVEELQNALVFQHSIHKKQINENTMFKKKNLLEKLAQEKDKLKKV